MPGPCRQTSVAGAFWTYDRAAACIKHAAQDLSLLSAAPSCLQRQLKCTAAACSKHAAQDLSLLSAAPSRLQRQLKCCELQACGARQLGCRTVFLGNTMTQHAPGAQGQLMFLHTNLSPKWNLHLPDSFQHYTKRWQAGPEACCLRLTSAQTAVAGGAHQEPCSLPPESVAN